jgi:hypothetical protein
MAHQLCTRKATHTALNRSARGHRFAAPCAIQPKRRDRPRLNHRRQTVDPRGFTRPKAAPRVPEDLQQVEKAVRQASATANQKSHQTVRAASGQRGESSEQNPKASCASPEEFRRLLYLQSQLPSRRQEKVQPDASPQVSDRMGSRTPRAPDLKRRELPAVDSRSANSTSDEKRLARKDRRFRYPDGPSVEPTNERSMPLQRRRDLHPKRTLRLRQRWFAVAVIRWTC